MEPAGAELRQPPRELCGRKEMMNSWDILGSLHIASFRRVTSAGGVAGAGKVAFTSYDI